MIVDFYKKSTNILYYLVFLLREEKGGGRATGEG